MKDYGVGLLGFGTVGAGVVAGLQERGDLIAERMEIRPTVRRIADLDLETDRGVAVDRDILTTDAMSVVRDEQVQVVVELIGGTSVAKELMEAALRLGKPVVTANKKLLAEHGDTLFPLAKANKTAIYFGASVGGGIPIIRALKEGLVANRIDSMYGILNGTCNYILSRMEDEGIDFDAVLKDAQAAGYAEADPALDVDGYDTAHKAVLLASLAYGFHVPLRQVAVSGIRGIARQDVEYGLDLGYRIKLLAVIKRDDSAVEVRVQPAMVPMDHMLASVHGVFNAVMVQGDMTGDTLYYGRGAGREPTASTVIADIADAMHYMDSGSAGRIPLMPLEVEGLRLKRPGEERTRHYIRMMLRDQAGVLAKILGIFGAHGISIASVLQQEADERDHVPVVILTHEAQTSRCEEALSLVAAFDEVRDAPVRICVEE